MSTSESGQIITFYSYKGGTGRTMALINVAVLATINENRKVLVIDWDLEAPGLHRFLYDYIEVDNKSYERINEFPGLINLFISIKTKFEAREAGPITEESCTATLNEIGFDKYLLNTSITGLQLLKAGAFDDFYAELINKYSWEQLFNAAPFFFKKFAEFLKKKFDFIFIDSRTGLTDTSGICSMMLPEKLCLVFTPNKQSLEGVLGVAKKALKYRLNSDDYRTLMIYPIASRVEIGEDTLRKQWRLGFPEKSIEGYQNSFESLIKNSYSIENCNLSRYFNDIQIQHVPKYAYGEEIAVLNANLNESSVLANAYSAILKRLLEKAPIWTEASDYDIYIAFSLDSIDIATNLMNELSNIGLKVINENFVQNINPTIEVDIYKEIKANVVNANIFIPIVGSDILDSRLAFEIFSFKESLVTSELKMILPIVIADNVNALGKLGLENYTYLILSQESKNRLNEFAEKIFNEILNAETRRLSVFKP